MARPSYQHLVSRLIKEPVAEFQLRAEREGITDVAAVERLSTLAGVDIPLQTYKNWKRDNLVIERSCRLREPATAGS